MSSSSLLVERPTSEGRPALKIDDRLTVIIDIAPLAPSPSPASLCTPRRTASPAEPALPTTTNEVAVLNGPLPLEPCAPLPPPPNLADRRRAVRPESSSPSPPPGSTTLGLAANLLLLPRDASRARALARPSGPMSSSRPATRVEAKVRPASSPPLSCCLRARHRPRREMPVGLTSVLGPIAVQRDDRVCVPPPVPRLLWALEGSVLTVSLPGSRCRPGSWAPFGRDHGQRR